jgi:hypothetical protein
LSNCKAIGGVALLNTFIGGNLLCGQGKFKHRHDEYSLVAQGANIQGSVFLNDYFKAIGCVSLAGASIGGNLHCDQGKFNYSAGRYVLFIEGTEIRGSITLRNGFLAKGRVSLLGARINGSLECHGGLFDYPQGEALVAQDAKIDGHVYLQDGFKTNGQVSFANATIGGSLLGKQCEFQHSKGHAFLAENIDVRGIFSLQSCRIYGGLVLSGGKIASHLIFQQAEFSYPNDWSLRCMPIIWRIIRTQKFLAGILFLRSLKLEKRAIYADSVDIRGIASLVNITAVGDVSFLSATIGGSLQCSQSKFEKHPKGDFALAIEAADIRGNVKLDNGFTAIGTVSLQSSTIVGNLECDQSKFYHPQGIALSAQAANVRGSVLLCGENFNATGEVKLLDASIGGSLDCHEGVFNNFEGKALNATGVNVKSDVTLKSSTMMGRISLSDAFVGGRLICTRAQVCNQGENNQPKKYALLIQGTEIKRGVALDGQFTAIGGVSLAGSTIGIFLNCNEGIFVHYPKGKALSVANANIRGDVDLSNDFLSIGEVFLFGADIGGSLSCNGEFINAKGMALAVKSTDIKGSVHLSKDFKAYGVVSFRNTTIEDEIRLEYQKPVILDLQFATVQTLYESQPLHKNLLLNEFIYEKINNISTIKLDQWQDWLRWQYKNDFSEEFSPQPYNQLAATLKKGGFEKYATEILIAKQEDKRHYGKLNWLSKWWSQLLGITIAHGYKPERAILWSLIPFFAGGIFFYVGYQQGAMCPSDLGSFAQNECPNPKISTNNISKDYPAFNAGLYSLDVFLPIIDLHQQNYWLPTANRGNEIFFNLKWGNFLRYYFWAHIIMGWVLTSLWVAGFTGLVRRLE